MAKQNSKAVRGCPGLYHRGDGRFHIRFRSEGRMYSEAAGRDLPKAKRRLAELRMATGRGVAGAADNHFPARELRDAFLQDRGRRCKATTAARYAACLDNVLGVLMPETVHHITPQRIEDYIATRAGDGMTCRTINHEVGVLKMMLAFGVRSQRIAANPLADVTPLPERDKAYRRAFTEAEVESLLNHVHPATGWGDTKRPCGSADVWAVLAYTGLRLGELTALRWADVDLKAGVLSVTRHDDDEGPKTAASVRRIPLAGAVRDVLVRLYGSGQDEDRRVFAASSGAPVSNLRRKLHACMKAAGVNPHGLCLHSFRYFFASRLISLGANPKTVQRLMGHASIAMTMRIYAQSMPGDDVRAIGLLDGKTGADAHQMRTTEKGFLARIG